jgi:hypothetical protein
MLVDDEKSLVRPQIQEKKRRLRAPSVAVILAVKIAVVDNFRRYLHQVVSEVQEYALEPWQAGFQQFRFQQFPPLWTRIYNEFKFNQI